MRGNIMSKSKERKERAADMQLRKGQAKQAAPNLYVRGSL